MATISTPPFSTALTSIMRLLRRLALARATVAARLQVRAWIGQKVHRFGYGIEDGENAVELCDLHHIFGAAGRTGEHHLAAAVAHTGQRRDQHADAQAVEPRRVAQA